MRRTLPLLLVPLLLAACGKSDDSTATTVRVRDGFQELRELRDRIAAQVPTATELSMGMTRDFEVAIEEGATIVRVGEAIFGARTRPTG